MCVCSGASWALALSAVNSREEGKLQTERARLGIPRSTRTRYEAVLGVKGWRGVGDYIRSATFTT